MKRLTSSQFRQMFLDFFKEHGHMIMWEDIAFSSALWANAQKVTNVHNILYYKKRKVSTIINNKDEKYKKNKPIYFEKIKS